MNRLIKTIIGFIILCHSMVFSQSVNVPLDHWVYDFLDRLQTRGLVRELRLSSRPYSRREVALMLSETEGKLHSGQTILSTTELSLFEQLKGEFYDELSALDGVAESRWYERHFTRWEENGNRIYSDLYLYQTVDGKWGEQYERAEKISQTTVGGSIRGQFKDQFGFFIFVKNTLTKGEDITEENFDPSLGPPVVISGKNVYSDDASAYLVWKLPWLRMEFGRDRAQWGPGIRGSLMLSANNPRFDMLKLKIHFKGFRFTSIHGKLSSGLGSKYIALHRLELTLFPWLTISGSESVIYGNRGIEPAYVNPIMPYHVAEHHLGDKDNNAMSFDVTAFPLHNHKFYFELFIDDFTTAKNPFTYYGNKFAFLTGWRWVAPMGIRDMDLQLEYARIEPYVYTHRDEINIYKNYDKSIGHWLGPNSDDLYIRSNYLINHHLSCAIVSERIRSGEGDIDTPHDMSIGDRKDFLSGPVETKWTWGIEARAQIFKDGFLSLNYYYIDTRNSNRIRSANSKDHQLSFQLLVNY